MTFLSPVFVGDEVTLYAELIATGRSSMQAGFIEAGFMESVV